MLNKIEKYMLYKGEKYKSPEKAENKEIHDYMLNLRKIGKEARDEFTNLAEEFQKLIPDYKLERVSNWMNQAQIIRPNFWVYFRKTVDNQDDPTFALRILGDKDNFTLSLEISFVERKISEYTLEKQNKVLNIPLNNGLYYYVQTNKENKIIAGTEENRKELLKKVKDKKIRKVLVKGEIENGKVENTEELTNALYNLYNIMLPYLECTYK